MEWEGWCPEVEAGWDWSLDSAPPAACSGRPPSSLSCTEQGAWAAQSKVLIVGSRPGMTLLCSLVCLGGGVDVQAGLMGIPSREVSTVPDPVMVRFLQATILRPRGLEKPDPVTQP